MTARYWLTPPDLYAALDAEFHFDMDPCPYPFKESYNGLLVPWGTSNYVNPPFCKKDAPFGGASAFAHKAIQEAERGATSVFILPVPHSIGLLLEAGAKIRNGGRVKWIEADTGEPCKIARRQMIAILRGKEGVKRQ